MSGLHPGVWVNDNVRLKRLLDEGGMGSIWVAEHKTLRTEVVVKFIAEALVRWREDAVERFSREASAAAQIKSPHVVQIFDHGVTADGVPYIVMELLEGETLGDRLGLAGPLEPSLAASIVEQTARALDAAHARGVIHRDIKPGNVFLTEAGAEPFVKVLDFGVAKQIGEGEKRELTKPGVVVGTPQYLSREVVTGGEVDHRADHWALAVTAYKALTGTLPFDGDSFPTICLAIVRGEHEPPSRLRPDLGPAVDAWFATALHEQPERRFKTGAEMAAALRDAIATDRASALDRRRHKRRRSIAMVATAGVLAGMAIAFGAVRGGIPGLSRGSRPSASAPATATAAATAMTTSSTAASAAASAGVVGSASAAPSATVSDAPDAGGTLDAGDAAESRDVAVPAGELWMGCAPGDDGCDADERPGRGVLVDAYRIDRHEVTVSDYARCVLARGCSDLRVDGYALDGGPFVRSTKCNWKQPKRENHPMNCVSWEQALRYCEWGGGRLPTEAEWEKAARGTDRRRFPWGNDEASCHFAVMADEGEEGCGAGHTAPVGTKPAGVSPFGVHDMAGNVREWVADWYDEHHYRSAPRRNPAGPAEGKLRVARGGSWSIAVGRFLRVSEREGLPPSTRSIHLGFRCARAGHRVGDR
jgi:serine/threonine-protein kinase